MSTSASRGEKADSCDRSIHIWRAKNIVWIKGRVAENRLHKHQALQLSWASSGTRLRLKNAHGEIQGSAVVVGGGVLHSLTMESGLVALVDCASYLAARLREKHLQGEPVASFKDPRDADCLYQELLSSSPGDAELQAWAKDRDERIVRVLDWLDELEASRQWNRVSLEEALARVHLSRSRFLHLFSEQVGSPWRSYLVWRRALAALTLASGALDLTQSAQAVGYSDSAHLSRQLSALFGFTPSSIVENSHFVQA